MDIPLKNLEVLVLDCQATGPNPWKGRLLEIGWARTCASHPADAGRQEPEVHLVDLPEGERLPRRVSSITGITEVDLEGASPPSLIWNRLKKAANETAVASGTGVCTAVVHFSRFEEPFITDLRDRYEPDGELPMKVVCTHKIAKRLLPDLPRRGIRAVAGYFGHSVPEAKRAGHHTLATAFIWQNLVRKLEEEHGITGLSELHDWLDRKEVPTSPGRSYPLDSSVYQNLPDDPGVYRMLRSNGDPLYVGKAKSLKVRVGSYFQKKRRHSEHILEMLSQVYDLDVTITGSALEAALLESDEVKRLSPPYNIALRERERRTVFCTRDFAHCEALPDETHPVGPLPSPESLTPLRTLLDLLTESGSTAESIAIERAMGMPEDYLPDKDSFREGMDEFRQRHEESIGISPGPRELIALGRQLWLERLHALDQEALLGEDEDEELEGELVEWVWTPEAVANTLESVVRRSTHMIRRGRWFTILSESSLAWEPVKGSGRKRTLVVIENGAIRSRRSFQANSRVPVPPGHARPFRERQKCFDLPTYDRMRVLTTEIRRLIAEGRGVELRPNKRSVLRNKELAKTIRWI